MKHKDTLLLNNTITQNFSEKSLVLACCITSRVNAFDNLSNEDQCMY